MACKYTQWAAIRINPRDRGYFRNGLTGGNMRRNRLLAGTHRRLLKRKWNTFYYLINFYNTVFVLFQAQNKYQMPTTVIETSITPYKLGYDTIL